MDNPFLQVMSRNSDEQLINILASEQGNYQPLAVEAAQHELISRNLPPEKIAFITAKFQEEYSIAKRKADEPLEFGFKMLNFIFPFPGTVIRVILAKIILEKKGYNRKADDVVMWTLMGACFYIALMFSFLFIVQ